MACVRCGARLEGVAQMSEPTLADLLDKLVTAVEEHSAVTKRGMEMLAAEIDALWKDRANLRDDVSESVTALSNRIEAVHR